MGKSIWKIMPRNFSNEYELRVFTDAEADAMYENATDINFKMVKMTAKQANSECKRYLDKISLDMDGEKLKYYHVEYIEKMLKKYHSFYNMEV